MLEFQRSRSRSVMVSIQIQLVGETYDCRCHYVTERVFRASTRRQCSVQTDRERERELSAAMPCRHAERPAVVMRSLDPLGINGADRRDRFGRSRRYI